MTESTNSTKTVIDVTPPHPNPTPYKPWHMWVKDGYYMIGIRNDIYKWTGFLDWIPNGISSMVNTVAGTELNTDTYMLGMGSHSITVNGIEISDERNVLVYVPTDILELNVVFKSTGSITRDVTARFRSIPPKTKLWILECSGTPLLSDVAGGFAEDVVVPSLGTPYAYTISKRVYHHTRGTVKPVWSYFYYKKDGYPVYTVTLQSEHQ
jgi:hypothetical protein